MRCNSWIVTDRATGAAVLETWEPAVARAVNRERYRVRSAYRYLCDLNARALLCGCTTDGTICEAHAPKVRP